MSFWKPPMAFQSRQEHPLLFAQNVAGQSGAAGPYQPALLQHAPAPPHSSHPALPHLTLLVFEAVLEVVCVSLPGYIIARQGLFTTEMQKFTANLNVALFTPCLIFIKLASKLTLDKLADLAIIPLIFIAQTLVSWLCSLLISKAFRFSKRPRNFVIAMGVFGNSNSLPISLVISLSKTISGLHWDKVPHDNDEEVQARGILYLLVFQQLGQLLRWSWGYNVLLAPPLEDQQSMEDGRSQMNNRDADGLEEQDGIPEERAGLLDYMSEPDSNEDDISGSDETQVEPHTEGQRALQKSRTDSRFTSGDQTPITYQDHIPPLQGKRSGCFTAKTSPYATAPPTAEDPNVAASNADEDRVQQVTSTNPLARLQCLISSIYRDSQARAVKIFSNTRQLIRRLWLRFYGSLPIQIQKGLKLSLRGLRKFGAGVWEFMNPPLWAMLAAIVVASIPDLQHLFFAEGTFVKNSVTGAISQSGNVAVPLILVVLGGNLARNTIPGDGLRAENQSEERKLVIASLLSRMLIPFCIMAPLLALTAKFVPVSILDDPIFVIVCFLITGAPSALQLAQICQINNVYVGAMTSLLFQSYVVWILPSTLILVMCALEVVEWAQQ